MSDSSSSRSDDSSASEFPDTLIQGLNELNALATSREGGDPLIRAVRELRLRAQISQLSERNSSRATRIVLTRVGDRFALERRPPPDPGFYIPGEPFDIPEELEDCVARLSVSFDSLPREEATRSEDQRAIAQTIEQGIEAIRHIIAYENDVEFGDVHTEPRTGHFAWRFVYRPNLDGFAQETDALNPPEDEPERVLSGIPEDLQRRVDAFFARIPQRITETEELALWREWHDLSLALAREMDIPWMALRPNLDDRNVVVHNLRRGEDIPLPPDWRGRVNQLNEQDPPASESDWEQLRRELAEFYELPSSHIERYPQDGIWRFWVFRRSLVPAAGEIPNGRVLAIPRQLVVLVRNAFRETNERYQVANLDILTQSIARAHFLPPGRVVIQPPPAVRCVYREPPVGQQLRIPVEIGNQFSHFRQIVDATERQDEIQRMRNEMAQYYGLEQNDLETIETAEGIVFQRRRTGATSSGQAVESGLSLPPASASGPSVSGGNVSGGPGPDPPILGGRGPSLSGPSASNPAGDLKPVKAPLFPGNNNGGKQQTGGHPLAPSPSSNGSSNEPRIAAIAAESSENSLSTGAIVGIVIGSISGVILIIVLIIYLRKLRSRKSIN